MNKEIGSEFWLSDLPIEHLIGSPSWISKWGSNVLTSSGRGAISLMLSLIENKISYKTVLLPAYICQSVIIPFKQKGYSCYFYDIKKDLTPDIDSIKIFLNKELIGVFVHMGYFGFSTNDDLYDYFNKKFKSEGTIIVEDLTHTLFSNYKRYDKNDYYIASLRKWTGLPSGGFLSSKTNAIEVNLEAQNDFSDMRVKALQLKREYIKLNKGELKQTFFDMLNEAEDILNNDLNPYSIDELSNSIINELDIMKLITKRRNNFSLLLKELQEAKNIRPVFDELPKEVCPLFFPIYAKEREKLKEALIKEKIYCPVHWPVPKEIDISKYASSNNIYKNILSIPCDQRYDIEDMRRVAANIKSLIL